MDTISQKWSLSADSADAPPPFVWEGKTVVPVEFHRYALALTVDILQRRAIGHARISFWIAQGGYPLLEMVPSPSRIEVDGQPLPGIETPRSRTAKSRNDGARARHGDVTPGRRMNWR